MSTVPVYGSAQRVLDDHPVALSGTCVGCGTYGCPHWVGATAALSARGQLPLRRPGASQPERLYARRTRVA